MVNNGSSSPKDKFTFFSFIRNTIPTNAPRSTGFWGRRAEQQDVRDVLQDISLGGAPVQIRDVVYFPTYRKDSGGLSPLVAHQDDGPSMD